MVHLANSQSSPQTEQEDDTRSCKSRLRNTPTDTRPIYTRTTTSWSSASIATHLASVRNRPTAPVSGRFPLLHRVDNRFNALYVPFTVNPALIHFWKWFHYVHKRQRASTKSSHQPTCSSRWPGIFCDTRACGHCLLSLYLFGVREEVAEIRSPCAANFFVCLNCTVNVFVQWW